MKRLKYQHRSWGLSFFGTALMGMSLMACGGASTSATGTTTDSTERAITGNLSSGGASLATPALVAGGSAAQLTADGCYADTVIATDTTGAAVTADVDAACDFSMELTPGKSYSIGFVLDGSFVASLVFDAGVTGFTSSALPVSDGTGAIDLGAIVLSGNVATSANNPLDECDSDDDGISDLDDSDDDNDGTDDASESDCDLDGVIDDNDDSDDDESCSASFDATTEARVLEVKPRNDPDTDAGEDFVDLDKEIKARIGCVIDESSVTSETFSVVAGDGTALMCEYRFSDTDDSSEHQSIKCRHESEDFLPDTDYTITISGVMCEDGRTVQESSWQFHTESAEEADDAPDAEDELDDEDEAEDAECGCHDDDDGDAEDDDQSEDDESDEDEEDEDESDDDSEEDDAEDDDSNDEED